MPVAAMSRAEEELRKKHKDARRESDPTSLATLEGSERRGSGTRRRSSDASQDGRGMYRDQPFPPPWNPWDADGYGGYFNPMTDATGCYGWPPPESWPSAPAPFPPPSCNACASMLYRPGAYPPSPYMPYQQPAYWPSPYAAFMPTPFYGYGYPPWGMAYPFSPGYGYYGQPGNGGSNEPGSDAVADRPSTSKQGRREGARRASNVSTAEHPDGARKSRTDKPDKKPPRDEPRKRP